MLRKQRSESLEQDANSSHAPEAARVKPCTRSSAPEALQWRPRSGIRTPEASCWKIRAGASCRMQKAGSRGRATGSRVPEHPGACIGEQIFQTVRCSLIHSCRPQQAKSQPKRVQMQSDQMSIGNGCAKQSRRSESGGVGVGGGGRAARSLRPAPLPSRALRRLAPPPLPAPRLPTHDRPIEGPRSRRGRPALSRQRIRLRRKRRLQARLAAPALRGGAGVRLAC
jgi:hypothetical protein